jgi:hypothetical protein
MSCEESGEWNLVGIDVLIDPLVAIDGNGRFFLISRSSVFGGRGRPPSNEALRSSARSETPKSPIRR